MPLELPQQLQNYGGWANRDTCGYFADYTAVVAKRLGDRVKHWMTINEPWVVAFMGNCTGEMAPGNRDERLTMQICHHLLLAHGLSMETIRDLVPSAKVGIVLSLVYKN